jgi:hypothetical protein
MEWLGDVVIGARLQSLDFILPAIACGQDQNRIRLAFVAQFLDQLQAGQFRQPEVDHREVECVFAPAIQALLAVSRSIDVKADVLELLHERFSQRSLVFYDEYTHVWDS